MQIFDNSSIIYRKGNLTCYYQVHNEFDTPILIKSLKDPFSDPQKTKELENEYSITNAINCKGVGKPLKIERLPHYLNVYFEYSEGQNLKEVLNNSSISLAGFFEIAIHTVHILQEIHSFQIIHKDISAQNIIYDIHTGKVSIIDFGLSKRFSHKYENGLNINQLEGTLAYISPEQTGQLSRTVDCRSDLYSLGIVFYELLTGKLPFEGKDSLDLVYAHLVKPFPLLHDFIPETLQKIIYKLGSKRPEDRYQSASGLLYDLEKCAQLWSQNNLETFALGSYDFTSQFLVSEKLYGRTAEIDVLYKSFQAISQGDKRIVFISGFSGVGKSRLVHEIIEPIIKNKGIFISGKFDQLQKDVPFSAFIQAFKKFITFLISESEEIQSEWRIRFLKSVGNVGRVLTDIIPELELIIGSQPSIEELEGLAAQNRFEFTLRNFIRSISSKEHPLVFFMDDLQWIDRSSLHLLEVLSTDEKQNYTMLICAYRDNEISSNHPFDIFKKEMIATQYNALHIQVETLNKTHIQSLIADTLGYSYASVQSLADRVFEITGGNVFYTHQLLIAAFEYGAIFFSLEDKIWQYDLIKIEAISFGENVVSLLMSRFKLLSNDVIHILKLASCIGNTFTSKDLSVIAKMSDESISSILLPALKLGLILPIYNRESTLEFKFIHDKIQQALYFLIPQENKEQKHFEIGMLLLTRDNIKSIPDTEWFEMANHLNLGYKHLYKKDKVQVAQLNLKVGKKARNSSAFDTAKNYFEFGILNLEDRNWRECHALKLELYESAAEVAYLCNDEPKLKEFLSQIFHNTTDILDQVRAYEIQILYYNSTNQLLKQVRTGIAALDQLGVKLTKKPNTFQVLKELLLIKKAMFGRKIEDLEGLDEMTDPSMKAAHSILTMIGSAAMYAVPELLPIIAIRATYLSIKYGNTKNSAYSYAGYAMILCGALNDVKNGYRFGQLALTVANEFPSAKVRPIEIFYSSIGHWKLPYKNAIKPLLEMYQLGLENGDFEFAAYSVNNYLYYQFFSGVHLLELRADFEKKLSVIQQLGHQTGYMHGAVYHQSIIHLTEHTETPGVFYGPVYDEREMMPKHKQANDEAMLVMSYFNRMMLSFYFDDFEKAYDLSENCKKYLKANISQPLVNLYYFFDSLICSSIAKYTKDKKAYLHRIRKNTKKLIKFSKDAPENFESKLLLIQAEFAMLTQDASSASNLYGLALEKAQQYDLLNDESLILERTGGFYYYKKQIELTQYFLEKAIKSYRKWGAIAKVEYLNRKFEFLSISSRQEYKFSATLSGTVINDNLDLKSVVKASKALSGDISYDNLLKRLMQVLLEHAGAQKGVLVLKNNKWEVVAINEVEQGTTIKNIALEDSSRSNEIVPVSILKLVISKLEEVLIADGRNSLFANEQYISSRDIKSIACLPLMNKGSLCGVIYLENNIVTDAFSPKKIETLKVINEQVAHALENALQFHSLKEEVDEKNIQITKQQEILEKSDDKLHASLAQAHRIQKSLIPTFDKNQHVFRDTFLMYQTTSTLHRDFYWFNKYEENFICALFSLRFEQEQVGLLHVFISNLLQKIQYQNELKRPEEVLNYIDQQIAQSLSLSVSEIYDKLDLAIINFEQTNKKIDFATRNVPLVFNNDEKVVKEGSNSLILKEGQWVFMYTNGIHKYFENQEGEKYNLLISSQVDGRTKENSLKTFIADHQDNIDDISDLLCLGFQID